MKYALMLAEFLSTPWALMPQRIELLARTLGTGQPVGPRAARALTTADSGRTGAHGDIAVLQLQGVITQRSNLMTEFFGGSSTQEFSSRLRAALTDDDVSQILIDIDSHGGSVYGLQELASEILSAREVKPVVAIANSLAASAAYWLGCCASQLYVTPGGEVGSIGVYQMHQDVSEALGKAGINVTLISAGKYKTEGNQYQELDKDAQSFLQTRINDYYGAFTRSVARGRGVAVDTVRSRMGQGRLLGANEALAEGMVDGVATIDQVIRKMQMSAQSAKRVSANRLESFQNPRAEDRGRRLSAATARRIVDILAS